EEVGGRGAFGGELVVPLDVLFVDEGDLELAGADEKVAGLGADPGVFEKEVVAAAAEVAVDAVLQVAGPLFDADLGAVEDEAVGEIVLALGGVAAPPGEVPGLDAAEEAGAG